MDPKSKLSHNIDSSNTSTSNCALQIALQTMKERCQQLQLRLSNLEDENLKLRIDKKKSENLPNDPNINSKENLHKLNEEIEILQQQKSQITNHIFMVATENKQLWTKLSMLTEDQTGNENNQTVPEQSLNIIKNKNYLNVSQVLDQNKISECKDISSIKDFEFNLSLSTSDESNNFELNDVAEELSHLKIQIRQILNNLKSQQDGMILILENTKKSKKDKDNNLSISLCTNCQQSRSSNNSNSSPLPQQFQLPNLQQRDKTYKINKTSTTMQEIDILDNNINDNYNMCPLCNYIQTNDHSDIDNLNDQNNLNDTFLEHVYNHFQESSSDDICSLINNLKTTTITTGTTTTAAIETQNIFSQINL